MKSKVDKILETILVLVLAGLVFEGIYLYYHWPRELPESKKIANKSKEIEDYSSPIAPAKLLKEEITLPESFALDIPFICQAPLGNWNPPFDHACEEGVILMIHYYFQNKSIDPIEAAQEIRDIIDFETKTYGFHEDTSAEHTAQLIRDYYGYKAKVDYDISLKDIKKELVQGNPVIVPTAGRLLSNPHFTPPGPIYHMLLIKGYNSTEFIVNDPGTWRGANFTYSYQVLEKAIHDWNEGNVEHGRKAMIVIYPPG